MLASSFIMPFRNSKDNVLIIGWYLFSKSSQHAEQLPHVRADWPAQWTWIALMEVKCHLCFFCCGKFLPFIQLWRLNSFCIVYVATKLGRELERHMLQSKQDKSWDIRILLVCCSCFCRCCKTIPTGITRAWRRCSTNIVAHWGLFHWKIAGIVQCLVKTQEFIDLFNPTFFLIYGGFFSMQTSKAEIIIQNKWMRNFFQSCSFFHLAIKRYISKQKWSIMVQKKCRLVSQNEPLFRNIS